MRTECEYGDMEYRLPSIPEGLELIPKIGIKTSDLLDVNLAEKVYENELYYIAQVIKVMEPFILKHNFEVKGKKLETWDEIIKTRCLMVPVVEAARAIMNALYTDQTPEEEEEKKD